MNHALRHVADLATHRVSPSLDYIDWRVAQANHLVRRVGRLLLPLVAILVAAGLLWLANGELVREGGLVTPLMCVAAAGSVLITGLFASFYERDDDGMP